MSKICGQPIRVMEDCSDGGDEQYIGQEGWVVDAHLEDISEVILPNTDDADKSAHFFDYQLDFLPILEIDKLRILTFYILTSDQAFGGLQRWQFRYRNDEAICKATGLDSKDCDNHYSLAESICIQTNDMPTDGTIQSMLINADKIVQDRFIAEFLIDKS